MKQDSIKALRSKKVGMTRDYWIIDGFDVHGWNQFTPTPGLCRTEADAKRYCRKNTTHSLLFSYRRVEMVVMEKE
jgi:hypothetical protein